MFRKGVSVAFLCLFAAGCTLYSDVDIAPLSLLPTRIERGVDPQSMVRKADYIRAMQYASTLDPRARTTASDLAALGVAYLAAGRFDDARTRLRAALDLEPFRETYADTAWSLSQVEYLSNNYELSLDWARIASEHGLSIRDWHMQFLEAMSGIRVYQFSGPPSASLKFRFGRPDVPRVNVKLNGTREVEGIIDSGAVLSIVSTRLADSLPIKRLGKVEGTFFGLLGEPIQVRFGILERLELGDMVIENIPVAIMPDEKMRFLVSRAEQKEFHMDFLLGSNLLKELRLELNFDEGHVTFTHLTDRDRRPDPDQNLFFEGFRPYVRGAVNRRGWFLFVLDTGSEITFLNESRLHVLPVSSLAGAHDATLQGLGGAMKRGGKIDEVEVGLDRWNGKFKTLPTYSSEENERAVGIIGQNFLKNFNVVIDFGRMRIDLKRR